MGSLGNAAVDILVVEDDDSIRDSVVSIFEMEGYSAASCSNGREAIDFLNQNQVGVVLLDLMLPIMSGEKFLEKHYQLLYSHNTPVVVLSAQSHDYLNALQSNYNGLICLQKLSTSVDSLLATVGALLGAVTVS